MPARGNPVTNVGLIVRRFLATTLLLRCPACGQGQVAKGFFGVKRECDVCGASYERFSGNVLISISLNYFLTCVAVAAVAVPLVMRYGFFDGLTVVLVAVAGLSVTLLLRPSRVLTLWFLWVLGFIVAPSSSDQAVR
jgi:uncharacterized protein (DUF983 family)